MISLRSIASTEHNPFAQFYKHPYSRVRSGKRRKQPVRAISVAFLTIFNTKFFDKIRVRTL